MYHPAMEPLIQYATTSDGVTIAYAEAGTGTPLVAIQPPPYANIEVEFRDWEWHRIMASRRRLIRFDNRGSGLSQRDVEDYSLDAMVSDVEAVVDALDLPPFVISGEQHAAPVAIRYAAKHPERLSHLALLCGYANAGSFYDIPELKSLFTLLEHDDVVAFTDMLTLREFGWQNAELASEMAAFGRDCMDLPAMKRFFAQARHHDVSDSLADIRTPTLVMHSRGALFPTLSMSQKLAAGIPGATFKVLESTAFWTNEVEAQLLDALDEFIGDAHLQPEHKVPTHIHRAPDAPGLVTLLFTDIESHTEMMHRLGDDAGRAVLREHDRITRDVLRTHAGREIKTTGDGFLATFTSASRAVDAAIALQRAFERHTEAHPDQPIRIRVGLNAGEPIAEDDDLFGSSVTLAARIMSKAEGGEIFASNVVRELCAGKGHLFSDRGETEMRGFEDPVRLYEVLWNTT